MYKIINTDTYSDIDGPYEVFKEVYELHHTDRNDLASMLELAEYLNDNFDGLYVPVPVETSDV